MTFIEGIIIGFKFVIDIFIGLTFGIAVGILLSAILVISMGLCFGMLN